MTTSYILNSDGLAALSRYVAPDTLFAFDLDGTLSPISDDYTAAQITEPTRATMIRLGKHAKVAVITGRARNDEDVFQQTGVDVFGIHVGTNYPTAARYYLNKQSEMPGVLDSMVDMLKSHGKI